MLTLLIIAAVTHQGAVANRVLGNPLFVWIGMRSYGLYLYHWPIYQIIRKVAGNELTVHEFVVAMVLTVIVTELSYRLVETPIRRGRLTASLRRISRSRNPRPRRILLGGVAAVTALSVFAGAALATAELKQNDIAESLDEGEQFTTDLTQSVLLAADHRTTESADHHPRPGDDRTTRRNDRGVRPRRIPQRCRRPLSSRVVYPRRVRQQRCLPTTVPPTTVPPTTVPPTTVPPTTVPATTIPAPVAQPGVVTDLAASGRSPCPCSTTGFRWWRSATR